MIQLSQGITLLNGQLFDFNEPGKIPVPIEVIANAAGNICRFAGHLPRFYSLAQHLVNTSRIVPPEHAFTALMHDTSEGFTNDITTPLKAAFPAFKELETRIEAAMAEMFGFEFPYPPEVHLADRQMLGLEMRHIKGDFEDHEVLRGIDFEYLLPLVDLTTWSPERAKRNFMQRYEELAA